MEYEDYKNMICKLAWDWHNKTGVDVEDLISEGNVAFCKAKETFEPELSSASNWVWKTVTLYLRSYCQKEAGINRIREKAKQLAVHNETDFTPSVWLRFEELVKTLSDEAKHLVRIVLASPSEFLDLANDLSGAVPVNDLCKEMIDHGVKWEETRLARIEIKKALREVV